MTFEITPQRFWSLPRFINWDEDEDFSSHTPFTNGLTIAEDEKHVYVEAAVPGIDPKNVEMTFDKGMLWVKAESKQEEQGKKYYRKASSSFSYRIAVPGDIDPTVEPEATYKNGVMHITFAKSPKSQPKKISVKMTK